mmetsp:Transcript_109908/g.311728  ORF Transcript_109908/g.311728 Transcript_109908/m.311728 type:complete len:100 (+) Transcript_109908:124-423(+)
MLLALLTSLGLLVVLSGLAALALSGRRRGRSAKGASVVAMSRSSTEEAGAFARDTTQGVAAKLEAGEAATVQQQARLGLDFWRVPQRQSSVLSTASGAK